MAETPDTKSSTSSKAEARAAPLTRPADCNVIRNEACLVNLAGQNGLPKIVKIEDNRFEDQPHVDERGRSRITMKILDDDCSCSHQPSQAPTLLWTWRRHNLQASKI